MFCALFVFSWNIYTMLRCSLRCLLVCCLILLHWFSLSSDFLSLPPIYFSLLWIGFYGCSKLCVSIALEMQQQLTVKNGDTTFEGGVGRWGGRSSMNRDVNQRQVYSTFFAAPLLHCTMHTILGVCVCQHTHWLILLLLITSVVSILKRKMCLSAAVVFSPPDSVHPCPRAEKAVIINSKHKHTKLTNSIGKWVFGRDNLPEQNEQTLRIFGAIRSWFAFVYPNLWLNSFLS